MKFIILIRLQQTPQCELHISLIPLTLSFFHLCFAEINIGCTFLLNLFKKQKRLQAFITTVRYASKLSLFSATSPKKTIPSPSNTLRHLVETSKAPPNPPHLHPVERAKVVQSFPAHVSSVDL